MTSAAAAVEKFLAENPVDEAGLEDRGYRAIYDMTMIDYE